MKKLLALVLALVMTMALAVTSNAAFKDADSIDYKEAVDVMNAVGVFVGDEKGNFNAKENLTREQAAKILAYLELGDKAADALVGGATFTDVASTRWSAGFVGFCAQAGIVSGVGDSKFDPAGQLTALQFGKMLLVELGYDAKVEGMVGTDWAINTSKLMAKVKLMDGIDGSVNQVLTREKAAQMTLNAIEAPMVTYENKGSSVTVNGAEINFGASTAKYETSTIAKDQNISKEKLTSGEYTVELGEKLYKDLKKNSTTDAFERPATEWKLKAASIGTYADAADVTYTKDTKISEIYADLGLSDGISKKNVSYYVDGAVKTFEKDIVKGDTSKIGGKGTLLDVYYDDDAETVTIIAINTYVAKVAASYKATSTKDAYVTLNTSDTGFTKPAATVGTYETESFAKDDIVAYTYSFKDGEKCVESMAALEKVTGAMSAYTTEGSVTVAGTKYDANVSSKSKIVSFAQTVDKGTDVTAYLDAYGYALYIDADTSDEYAVVLDYGAGSRLESARVKLLFADGTTKKVDLDKTNKTIAGTETSGTVTDFDTNVTDKINKYDIVSYTINSDGEYSLKLLADSAATVEGAATDGTQVLKNGSTKVTVFGATSPELVQADGETIFMTMNKKGSSDATYSSYTGISNVPDATVKAGAKSIAAVYTKTGDTAATVVFLFNNDNVKMSSSNKDVVFVKGNGDGQSYTKDLGYFYEYTAFINGEKTTIKVDTDNRMTKKTLVYGPEYNDKGILNGYEMAVSANNTHDDDLYFVTGTKAPVNGVITLSSTPYAYAKDCNAYLMDVDGNLTQIDVTSIGDDENDNVWFKLDDDIITDLYVETVDEAEEITPSTETGYYSVGAIAAAGSKNVQVVIYKADKDGNRISGALSKTELKALGIKDSDVTVTTAGDVRNLKCGAGEEGTYYIGSNSTKWNFTDSAIAYFDGAQFDGSTGFTSAYGATAGFMKIHLDNYLFNGELTVSIKTVNGNVFFADSTTL